MYVSLELRDEVDEIGDDTIERLRRETYGVKETIRTLGNRVFTIHPAATPPTLRSP